MVNTNNTDIGKSVKDLIEIADYCGANAEPLYIACAMMRKYCRDQWTLFCKIGRFFRFRSPDGKFATVDLTGFGRGPNEAGFPYIKDDEP